MISVTELKEYLNIPAASTTLDTELQSIINQAVATLEAKCSRVLLSKTIEEWQSGDGNSYMFLSNPAITAVSLIEELDSNYSLSSFAASTDVYLTEDDKFTTLIRLKNNLTFTEGYKNIKVTYTAGYKQQTGTGTISIPLSSKSVTGVNTLFTTELVSGDRILSEGQAFIIDVITSNTVMTVTTAASAAISAKSYSITNVPEDLRTAMFIWSSHLFYLSNYEGNPQSRLGVKSYNVSGEINTNVSYEEPNIDKYIQIYKQILL